MSLKKTRFIKGIILAPDSVALDGLEGEFKVDSATGKIQATLKDGVNPSAAREVLTNSQTQTITNKTIDASLNTVSNISDTNLSASAAISRSKVASGTADHVVINSGTGALSSEAALAASRGGLGTSGAAFTGVVKASSGTFSASTVVDVDISATAAVARTKLASGTANRVVVNDGTGVISDAAAITASRALVSDANGIPTASATTASELGFVSGVTSAIQTQFSGKENTITTLPVSKGGTNSSTALNNNRVVQSSGGAIVEAAAITAARALISDANGIPTHSTVTSTTLDFLDATSSVQTQINSKVNSSGGTLTSGSVVTPSRLDVKQDTLSNLTTYALTASNGQLCFATDTKQMFQVLDTALVSVGSSAGGFDSFINLDSSENLNTWSNGNNASYLGGGALAGTFAKDSSTSLNGASSYLYTQAAGSLNDYLASPAQAVPVRFRGNTNTFTFSYLYNGNSTDIEPVVYDVTNATKLNVTTNLLPSTGNNASLYKANIFIPLTCLSIRVGFQVKVLNSGKILEFDDVQLSADTTKYADPSTSTGWQSYTPTFQGFGTPTSVDIEWRQDGTNIDVRGTFITGTTTAVQARIGLPNNYTIRNTITFGVVPDGILVRHSVANDTFHFLQVAGNSYVNLGVFFRTASADTSSPINGDVIASSNRVSFSFSVPVQGLLASNPMIVTASESFSTDTASLVYAPSSTYTLTTLANAPVGTFITFTYAASSNTRTQTTTAPTQTTSDMNSNGVRVFARAYNASSTAGNPATVAIQIGKNFKGTDLQAFGVTSKTTPLCTELFIYSGDTLQFGTQSFYDEKTGVIFIDAGYNYSSLITTRRFALDQPNNVAYNDGYFVINASKSPALVGVPQVLPRIATLAHIVADGSDGGTFTSGAWQTRPLNTLVDTSGIGVSLVANEFTIPAGEYYVEFAAIGFAVDQHQLRLRNITDSTTSIFGLKFNSSSGGSGCGASEGKGYITLTSSKVFQLQHRCGTTKATNGFGSGTSPFGENCAFANIKITKVK
jgi:hypothetical protein